MIAVISADVTMKVLGDLLIIRQVILTSSGHPLRQEGRVVEGLQFREHMWIQLRLLELAMVKRSMDCMLMHLDWN